MLSTRIDRGRIIFLGLALAMIPALAAFAPSDEPGDSRKTLKAGSTCWPRPAWSWTAGRASQFPLKPNSIPKSQWSLDPASHILICQGDGGHEWLRLDQTLTDYIFHVEWRFTPVPGKKGYNSGVYVRNSSDGKTWHQAQCGDASGGYLFGETLASYALKPFNFRKDVHEQRVMPAGEWNTYELTCKGRNVTLWVNGAVTNSWKSCQVPRGFAGLEAEGWRIEFRNVKVKLL